MSVYYDFYFGKLNTESKKMDMIGPKIDGKLHSFYNRSRSFIDGEEIEDNMALWGSEYFTDEFWTELGYKKDDAYRPNIHLLNMKQVSNNVTRGLVKGYVTLDDLKYLSANDYDEDAVDGVMLYKSDVVAEMEESIRKEYVLFAAVNTRKFGYICGIATELFDDYDYKGNSDDYYMICVKG